MPLMTMKEAIEIVTEERKEHHSFSTDVIGQAEQLLILAGERIRSKRKDHWVLITPLLPGEAPE